MLEAFFSRIEVIERLRPGLAGPYLEGFAEYLARSSYEQLGGQKLLHVAWHFTTWAQGSGTPITALDGVALEGFQRHLSSSRCDRPNGGKGKNAGGVSRLFVRFLGGCGVVQEDQAPPLAPLVQGFRDWMVLKLRELKEQAKRTPSSPL